MIPPYSNRGVYPSGRLETGVGSLEGIDAYNCTVFANADMLFDELTCLIESAGLEPRQEVGPPIKFYARNLLLLAPTGHRLLQVRAGGTNPHPFVEVKGEASQLVAQYIRDHFGHRPSRIDHALDRRGAGLFNKLARFLRSLAGGYRLKFEPRGDWVTADAGRTIYLGSRQSQVFLRVYEKGLKYAHELGLEVTLELREWVRVELEFKPQNMKARLLASTITPAQIWGCSQWTAELAKGVLSIGAEAAKIRERRESNRDRALRFMACQYRVHLESLLVECGRDVPEFGLAIAELADIGADYT